MRNVHCHPQTLWLGGKIVFLGSCFSSCPLVLPQNKEGHFYLQMQITLLVFGDGKENAIFLKGVGNNSLSISCLPCVCLFPVNYTEQHKVWSSTAQHWHSCWRDQVDRPESAVTVSWGILPSYLRHQPAAYFPFLIPYCLYFIIGNIHSVTSHFFYSSCSFQISMYSINVMYTFYHFSSSGNLSKQKSWLIFFFWPTAHLG